MRREGVTRLVAVVLATAFVTAVWGWLLATWPPEPPASSVAPSPADSGSSRPSSDPSGSGTTDPADRTTAVVLGDSFTSGMARIPAREWPELLAEDLGWTVVRNAAPGTGYLNPGTDEPFAGRVDEVVAERPDVVLVAGGVNDLAQPADEIAAAAEDVVVELQDALPDAQLVLLSPFSNGPPGSLTSELADRLEEVAAATGVAHLDVTDMLPLGQDLIAEDGLHPTPQGHRVLADGIREGLAELGVADSAPPG